MKTKSLQGRNIVISPLNNECWGTDSQSPLRLALFVLAFDIGAVLWEPPAPESNHIFIHPDSKMRHKQIRLVLELSNPVNPLAKVAQRNKDD